MNANNGFSRSSVGVLLVCLARVICPSNSVIG